MTENTTTGKTGPLPPTYFFILLCAGIVLHFVFPVLTIFRWPFILVGLLPLVVGVCLTLLTDQMFKQCGTTVKPHEDAGRLITTGPYRFSRHPMYLGMTLILLGVALLLGSVLPYVTALLFALIMQVKFVPVEETSLERIFGKEYATYRKRVRCWI